MRKTQLTKTKLLCATALFAGLATPAWAQNSQTTNDEASNGGDIIVTARRSEERLQDVPISMTVLNQEQLSQHNIVNTTDLGNFVPSLQVDQQFGPEKASFVIRGFVQPYHTAPTVGVYFADVIAPRSLGPTTSGNGAGVGSMFDLENLQVLKGPQGTLFGRNTTGGAILLVPTKPKDEFGGYIEGSLGNFNMHRIQAVLNVPVTDTFKLRAGVDWNQADGYVHNLLNIGPKDFDNTNYVAVRVSALWNVTPDLDNYTIFNYSRSDTHGAVPHNTVCNQAQANDFLATFNPREFLPFLGCMQVARDNAPGRTIWDVENTNANPRELVKQMSIINTTTWRASDNLTIKNIFSYSQYRESASFSLWGTNFAIPQGFPGAGTPIDTITLEPGFYPWTTTEDTITEELQFQGHTSDGRFTWQAGAYLEASHPPDWNAQLVDQFITCTDISHIQCIPTTGGAISDANTKDWFNDKALYAQATYKLTDQLSLTGGIRYTWDKMTDLAENLNIAVPSPAFVGTGLFFCQNILQFNTGAHNPPLPSDALFVTKDTQNKCDNTIKISSNRPTWLIDLDYKPNPDMLIYAKWARGYRMGSITSNSVGFETVGPEKLDLYEVGAKTSFRGAVPGYFNIAAFYNDFHNQQIGLNPTLLPEWQGVLPNASPNVNAGHSRIWGIEVDSSFKFGRNFKLDIGYTYLNTRVLAAQLPTIPPYYDPNLTFLQAAQGDKLALSPTNTIVITGTYTLPLDDSIGKISLGATFNHTDAFLAEALAASPVALIKAENQLNLNVDWRNMFGHPIDLAFYMTNVTNQARILFPSSSYTLFGMDGGQANQPRMWGFRLKWRFGD